MSTFERNKTRFEIHCRLEEIKRLRDAIWWDWERLLFSGRDNTPGGLFIMGSLIIFRIHFPGFSSNDHHCTGIWIHNFNWSLYTDYVKGLSRIESTCPVIAWNDGEYKSPETNTHRFGISLILSLIFQLVTTFTFIKVNISVEEHGTGSSVKRTKSVATTVCA